MMKNYIKKTLMVSSLIMLVAHTVPSIMYGNWSETTFLWELLLVSGLICLAQLLSIRFSSNYYIIELLAEYCMVCMIVGLTGLIFHWFRLSYLWNVFLYVTPVYIISYFLDLVRTKRDVDYINEKIKQRTERG